MQIDEPPIATMCSGCSKPLVWIFSARALKWVAVIPDPMDARTMRVHDCRDGIPQVSRWDRHEPAPVDSPARVAAREIAAAAASRGES
jgi:hypothetical protein